MSEQAYAQLSPGMQRWIWDQGWASLRPIQAEAIERYNTDAHHIIISARTASGKTEAAFLPLLSHIEQDPIPTREGMEILYVAPLKALIHDQYERLMDMTRYMDCPVYEWHGDASAGEKRKVMNKRNGIVLITPESLEGIVTNQRMARELFGNTKAIVIDEMHAFLEDSRGRQLQSLMHRIELSRDGKPPIRRIGLSATLASMQDAAEWIMAGDPHGVSVVLEGVAQPTTIHNQAIIVPIHRTHNEEITREHDPFAALTPDTDEGTPTVPAEDADDEPIDDPRQDSLAMALWDDFSMRRGLIFANSRAKVELLSTRLEAIQFIHQRPPGFIPHHGSLSRFHRSQAETAMKDDSRQFTLVCTSTLEMGIDVGGIERVGQIGPCHRVSALRQRTGRSGRKSGHSQINQYIELYPVNVRAQMGIAERLCLRFVRMLAMGSLLNKGWNEPVNHRLHDLSTLLHQILATIKQREGTNAKTLWRTLSPVWPQVSPELFMRLLRDMRDKEILEAGEGATILPGALGERLLQSQDFPVTFPVPEVYTVRPRERPPIGHIPLDTPMAVGTNIIFGGKYWKVIHIDQGQKIISVVEARNGTPPVMIGEMGMIHDVILQEMRDIYMGVIQPAGMDAVAQMTLEEARQAFMDAHLDRSNVVNSNDGIMLFPWAHPNEVYALIALLTHYNYDVTPMGEYLIIKDTVDNVLHTLQRHADTPLDEELRQALTDKITIPHTGKYDEFIDPGIMHSVDAIDHVDLSALPGLCRRIIHGIQHGG